MSGRERTGWRDEGISRRHRSWGFNVPAVDIDFLLCEFDQRMPVALIDYKLMPFGNFGPFEPGISAQRYLANRAGLPAYVVRYAEDYSRFEIHPINWRAKEKTGEKVLTVDEARYIKFLHYLRGRKAA